MDQTSVSFMTCVVVASLHRWTTPPRADSGVCPLPPWGWVDYVNFFFFSPNTIWGFPRPGYRKPWIFSLSLSKHLLWWPHLRILTSLKLSCSEEGPAGHLERLLRKTAAWPASSSPRNPGSALAFWVKKTAWVLTAIQPSNASSHGLHIM